jgi:hypothetical protein
MCVILLSYLCRYLNLDDMYFSKEKRLGLWCLTTRSTIFQLYRGGQFYYCWRKPKYLGKNRPAANHRQILSHKVVHLAMSGIQIHNFFPFYFLFGQCVVCPSPIYGSDYPFGIFKLFLVMIGIGCICGCKSNYHTIMIATAPQSIIRNELCLSTMYYMWKIQLIV